MKEYRFRATYKDHLGNVVRHETFTVLGESQQEAAVAADDRAELTTVVEEYRTYRLRYLGIVE